MLRIIFIVNLKSDDTYNAHEYHEVFPFDKHCFSVANPYLCQINNLKEKEKPYGNNES